MTKTNYLKTEKFKDLASNISDVTTDLRLMRHTIEFVRKPNQLKNTLDISLEYHKLSQYVDELHSKIQHLEQTLDSVGSTLYSVDSLEDLKTCVADDDINYLADNDPIK